MYRRNVPIALKVKRHYKRRKKEKKKIENASVSRDDVGYSNYCQRVVASMIERYDCWPKKITLGYSCTIYQYFCNRLSCIVRENRGSLGMIKKKLRFILAQNTSVQSRDMYFLLKKNGRPYALVKKTRNDS